jgi:hypothetical protein
MESSATLTMVPSRKTMADPRIVETRTAVRWLTRAW